MAGDGGQSHWEEKAMSLGDMRCDRCHEMESDLFRVEHSELEAWYCSECLAEIGQPLDTETI